MGQIHSSPGRVFQDSLPVRLLGTAARIPLLRRGTTVMFHLGRCGSSVLGDLLGQHPEVFWDKELYQQMRAGVYRELRLTNDPKTLLRLRMLRAGRRFYGFEMKFLPTQHLSPEFANISLPHFVAFVRGLGYERFIVLKRRNYLRQAASKQVGVKTGQWAMLARDKSGLNSVVLDVKNCERFGYKGLTLLENFQLLDAAYAGLDELLHGQPVLHLTYEDDVLPDPMIGYGRICDFLGLRRYEDVRINRGRQNPFPLSQLVANLDDVECVLRGTAYEWMLHE